MSTRLEWVYPRFKVFYTIVILPVFIAAGFLGAGAVLSFGMDMLYCLAWNKRHGKLLFGKGPLTVGIALMTWLFFVWMYHDFAGGERLIQFLCAAMTYYVACTINWNRSSLAFLRKSVVAMMLLYLLWWPISGFSTSYYAAFYLHGNFLGGVIMCFIAVLLFTKELSKSSFFHNTSLVLALFILLLTNSRSALISVIVLILAYFILKRSKMQGKRLAILFLIAIVGCSLIFIVVYPQLATTELGIQLNLLSRYVFRKNLFSGREIIWANIEKVIMRAPILGYGLDKVPSDFYKTAYSSHNLWLQMSLQSGIPSVVLLLLFLLAILRKLLKSDYPTWHLTAAFVGAVIIHEVFEVSLLQNNLAIGLIVWLILGILSSKSMNRETIN